MTTDPIADYLTRIRNASAARLKMVEIPSSGVKRAMTTILFDQGQYVILKNQGRRSSNELFTKIKREVQSRSYSCFD